MAETRTGETVNREYKSTLFAYIFSNAENALALYNAVNGTDYGDPSGLEFNTLENVLYLGMKNDISFLFATRMNLYEHQSTWNPNMPLRGVFYLSALYKKYVAANGLDIYSSTKLPLPTPRYIVFYNGTEDQPETQELRLSDSYELKCGDAAKGGDPALECVARVVNINYGRNQEMMARCRLLGEYAWLVNRIRKYCTGGLTLEAAVEKAVDDGIGEGILADILTKHRAEVTEMILEEYDEEFHIRCEKKLSYSEGEKAGYASGEKAGYANGEKAGYANGEKAGYANGEKAGVAGGICDMLDDRCTLPDAWRERILAEDDLATLKAWLKIAGRAESLDEFLVKAGLE